MNPIIIPTVVRLVSPSDLQQAELPLFPEYSPTHGLYSKAPHSDKSLGAFKLYKTRKTRKHKVEEPEVCRPEEVGQRKTYRLVTKNRAGNNYSSNLLSLEGGDQPPAYYDPYEAPLLHGQPLVSLKSLEMQSLTCLKEETTLAEIELKIV